jgi:hypothetical protein
MERRENMKFYLDKFSDDELTRETKLAEWIAANCEPVADDECDGIFRIVINVRELNDDSDEFITIHDGLAWVAQEMGNSRDIWICWTQNEEEITDWWITGDDC